jgi:hypothetical protein
MRHSIRLSAVHALLLTTLTLGLPSGKVLAAGGTVRNGADGLSQLFFRAVYRLDKIITEVLRKHPGEFSAEDARILTAIAGSLASERAAGPVIEIKAPSGADQSDFVIDGIEKIAYTGDAVGDRIFVNKRMALDAISDGSDGGLGYVQVLQILVHELGHHHGIADHAALDLLGTQVAYLTGRDPSISQGALRVRECHEVGDSSRNVRFEAVDVAPYEDLRVGRLRQAYDQVLLECQERNASATVFAVCSGAWPSGNGRVKLTVDRPENGRSTILGTVSNVSDLEILNWSVAVECVLDL